MIFTERTIRVSNGTSSISSPIILYKGDKNIKIRFKIVDCPYTYSKNVDNIIETSEASYAQLIIKTPNNGTPILSNITEPESGYVTFIITGEMIDEAKEVGKYSLQVRLLDDEQYGRITIPEVIDGIEVRKPMVTEGVSTTNEVDVAVADYALTTAGVSEDAFDSQGNYNKTTWGTGDRITAAKLNKIEAGIEGVNNKVSSGGTGNIDLSGYAKKADLPTKTSQLTNDSGYITNIPDEYITENKLNAKGYATTSQIPTVPTNVSAFTNDANYASETYVSNKIAEASLSGGEVDLSGYVTKEIGNASQIRFADGETFQAKLDNGTLKGEKGDTGEQGLQGIQGEKGDPGIQGEIGPQGPAGADGQDGLTTAISVNGNTYTHVDGTITLPNYPIVPTANGITIADTAGNFTATNVEEALAELFQFVSNGKSLIASAITDMGISTSNTDTFQVMANNIRMISGGSGEIITYTITNNLTNCSTNNSNNSISKGSSYTATITPNTNYAISSITVTMGGADITSSTVSMPSDDASAVSVSGETLYINGPVSGETLAVSGAPTGEALSINGVSKDYATINIPNVTGNIVITASASVTQTTTAYTITNNLSNCSTSNSNTSINSGSSYSATISPNANYEISSITVTMGGTDITSSVVSGNTINISNVTGNIVITATATQTSSGGGSTTNLLPPLSQWTKSSGITAVNASGDYSATITSSAWWESISTQLTGISTGDNLTISCSNISSTMTLEVVDVNEEQVASIQSGTLTANITVGNNLPYTVMIYTSSGTNGTISDVSLIRR